MRNYDIFKPNVISIQIVIVIRQSFLNQPSQSYQVVLQLIRLRIRVESCQEKDETKEVNGLLCSVYHIAFLT